jgi:citronellol/citronellal dehydrogenase
MNGVNSRGTFVVAKLCIPHLKKAANPHIMILCPPPNMQPYWFGNHLPYSMAKYGMTMVCLGLSHELQDAGIAVNGLWPLTTVATAAVNNVLGGDTMMQRSRNTDIMSDAAYIILTQNSKTCTGNFFVDEDLLRATGTTCFKKYLIDPNCKEEDLIPDFFLEPVRKG